MLLLLCSIPVVYENLCLKKKINDVNYLVFTYCTILFYFPLVHILPVQFNMPKNLNKRHIVALHVFGEV